MSSATESLARQAMEAHRAHKFLEAEAICRQALDQDPGAFRSLVHLSVLLRNRGAFSESIDCARRAIEQDPQASDGHVQLALALLGSGAPAESIVAFERAIALSPPLAALHYHLGLALENVGRIEEAKSEFIAASKIDPRDVRSRISFGALLLTEEDLVGARREAEAALRLDPNYADAHLLMAKLLVAEENGDQAEQSIRRALMIDPRSSYAHSMLGFRLLRKGDFQGAEEECLKSIECDPAQGVAYYGITQARKIKDSDRPLLEQMLQVLQGVPLPLEQASYLEFGLGKAFDNLGEYERAMAHFDAAHERAVRFRTRDGEFDREDYASHMASIRKLYTADALRAKPEGFDSDLPIFVVGMMRSGTTLTEQILSSHPKVGAAGEQWFWSQRQDLAENLESLKFDRAQAKTLAREYCRELRKVAPNSERITDKLPGNYQRLGLLSLALPNAKFIHCRRHPIDTSLSIYFTANPVAPAYTHSKDSIAFVYEQYLQLMDHWRAALPPNRMFEIQYEELVADPEPVIRGMIDFLGLDWDEACLRHDQNKKEVRTPSLWQVRQPMYSSSVERWRNYEPWLGGLRALADLVPPPLQPLAEPR